MAYGLFDLLSLQGVTFNSSNVSSSVNTGFEEKDGRQSAYLKVTSATFETDVYLSLAIGNETKVITAAQAKTLPGVTAGESIIVYGEIFADDLSNDSEASIEITFFDETATVIGTTTQILCTEEGEWIPLKKRITVPASATRVNVYLHAHCVSQPLSAWMASLKIKR